MRDHTGIVYQPDQLASRRQLAISGATVALVQVPPVAHSFQHRSSSHLLMFTERGKRRDGESRAEGRPISTLRDTSNTYSILPADIHYNGWTLPTVPARYLSLAIERDSPLLDLLPRDALWRAPVVYGSQIPAEIGATLAKLRAAVAMTGNHLQLYGEALFSVLMVELAQWLNAASPAQPWRGGLAQRQLRLVCDFIRAELAADIPLATLAALCGLSPNHFAAAFRRSVGMAPHQFQVRCRIEQAKAMLQSRDIPIIDIALTVGYATPSAFAASFRRQTGMTPRDYRRSLT